MRYEQVLHGADPELFLIDPEGKYVSSIGKVGGSKAHPKKIDAEGSAIQEDNVAVEFNIIPAPTREDFLSNIEKVLRHLQGLSNSMGLQLAADASAFFEPAQLSHPKAQEFGCEPDFDAWALDWNPPPAAPQGMENLRTCGGHLHLSWVDPTDRQRIELVRTLDVFCGVPSVLMDKDETRRKLYGRAGACRLKAYGVEYRVLSNFWLRSPESIRWLYDQSNKAIDFLNNNGEIEPQDGAIIKRVINDGDKTAIKFLMDKYPVE